MGPNTVHSFATVSLPVAQAVAQHIVGEGVGVGAAIIGALASYIALRVRRKQPQPAPAAQPAPRTMPRAAAPGFGEPAPPTSPDRRLYPGPVPGLTPRPQEGPSAKPTQRTSEPPHIGTALFNPELLTPEADEGTATEGVSAQSVTQAAQASGSDDGALVALTLPHTPSDSAPLWASATDLRERSRAASISSPAVDAEAPIWTTLALGARPDSVPPQNALVQPQLPDSLGSVDAASGITTDDGLLQASALGETSSADEVTGEGASEATAPIWKSFLNAE